MFINLCFLSYNLDNGDKSVFREYIELSYQLVSYWLLFTLSSYSPSLCTCMEHGPLAYAKLFLMFPLISADVPPSIRPPNTTNQATHSLRVKFSLSSYVYVRTILVILHSNNATYNTYWYRIEIALKEEEEEERKREMADMPTAVFVT